MSARNRRAGNSYERAVAQEMRNFGFDAVTSRYASKMTDDLGIDLVGTDPFSIQCKFWKSAPSYHQVLAKMPQDSNYNLIFHKRPRQGEVVVMSKADFYELLGMLVKEGIIKP